MFQPLFSFHTLCKLSASERIGFAAKVQGSLPLLVPTAGVVLGSVAGLRVSFPYWWCLFALGALLLLVPFLMWRRWFFRPWRDALFIIGVFLSCFGFGAWRGASSAVSFAEGESSCRLVGCVDDIVKRKPGSVTLALDVDTVSFRSDAVSSDVNVGRKVMVRVKQDASSLAVGDRVVIYARTVEPFVDGFSGFDYREYLVVNGFSMLAEADTAYRVGSAPLSVGSVAGNVSHWFVSRLASCGVSAENVGFLRALVLADRSELSSDVRSAFAACGTSHVLAVSGMHVGVISGLFVWLLGRFLRRKWVGLLGTLFVWLYALLVGLSPSVMRAATMITFLNVAPLFGRALPRFHSLTAALFFIAIFDPRAVLSVGLWLSFAAVGGLVCAMPAADLLMERVARPLRPIVALLSASLVAQVSTAPVILFSFHQFPLYFLLHNLFVVPAIMAVFVGALLVAALGSLPFVGSLLGAALGLCLDFSLSSLVGYCEWASHWPCALVDSISFGIVEFVGLTLVVVSLLASVSAHRFGKFSFLFVSLGLATMAVGAAVPLFSEGAVVYASRGLTSVAIFGRGTSQHLHDDASHGPTLSARADVARQLSVDVTASRNLRPLEILSVRGYRIAVISSNDALDELKATQADAYVINADVMPHDISLPQGAKLYVSPSCPIAQLWKAKIPNVTLLERNGVWRIK